MTDMTNEQIARQLLMSRNNPHHSTDRVWLTNETTRQLPIIRSWFERAYGWGGKTHTRFIVKPLMNNTQQGLITITEGKDQVRIAIERTVNAPRFVLNGVTTSLENAVIGRKQVTAVCQVVVSNFTQIQNYLTMVEALTELNRARDW